MPKYHFAVVLAAALLAGGSIPAIAQSPPPVTPSAPVAGANSFTEAQAKERIEKSGYTAVTSLRKDDKGVWRATAKKGEAQVNVSLDFRGNVVAQ